MSAGLAWQPSLFGDVPVRPDASFATLRRIRLDADSWVDHAPGWLAGEDRLFDELLASGEWKQRERWMYDKQVVEPRLTAGFHAPGVALPFRRAMARSDAERHAIDAEAARLLADPRSLDPTPHPSATPPRADLREPNRPAAPRTADDLREVAAEQVDDLVPGGDAGTATSALPPSFAEICDLLSARYGVGLDSVWVNLYRDGSDSVAWHGDRNARVLTNPLVVTVSLGARRRFLLRPRGGGPASVVLTPGQGDLVVMGGACQHAWEHCVPKTRRPVGPRMSVTIRHSR